VKSCFVANSAWYLKNFRGATLKRFSESAEVLCIFPEDDGKCLLNDFNCSAATVSMQPTGKNPILELRSIFCLFIALKKHRPDLVFSFNPKTNLYSLVVCWLLSIPCVPNVSGVGAASQLKGVIGYAYRTASRFFYRRAAHVYFQNPDDMQEFIRRGWVEESLSELIPGSGVDLVRFAPTSRLEGPVRFLMAARLIKQKGVVEYLEAARKVLMCNGQAAEFWLAGVPDHSRRAVATEVVESYAQQPGIKFLGHVEDMPKLLAQVDCVVLPSYYPEGIPRSLIEAAAAGKAIITTDMPGCREVVEPRKNGFLVASRSVEALVAAMQQVLGLSRAALTEMQQSSRALAERRFDERIVIDSYLRTAERITGEAMSEKLSQ
jgi:glycosyltransferase involved in cell wall biosynthesis